MVGLSDAAVAGHNPRETNWLTGRPPTGQAGVNSVVAVILSLRNYDPLYVGTEESYQQCEGGHRLPFLFDIWIGERSAWGLGQRPHVAPWEYQTTEVDKAKGWW